LTTAFRARRPARRGALTRARGRLVHRAWQPRRGRVRPRGWCADL